MSKGIRISIVTLLLILIALPSVINNSSAQQGVGSTSVKPAPDKSTKTLDAIAAANEILEEVSKMRGLKVLNPVKSGIKSRSEIRQEVIRNFEESMKPEELDAINKTLIAYGLVPQDFKYRDFMVSLLTEQVAGFYRPKSKELFLADWNDLNQQRPVMAHELTHALQDQHFNLLRFEDWPRGDSDRETAIHALIEGDATGVMYNYQLKSLKSDITRLPSFVNFSDQAGAQSDKDGQQIFNSAPAVIKESLIFPYVYGVSFIQEIVKKQGWASVTRAYTELPQSTEQIIHIDKYLAHEQPIVDKLPDLTSVLTPGWKKIDTDVSGEFGYFIILSEFIGKKEARPASQGWGGDQFTLYENLRTKQLLLVHRSIWDTKDDAEEFFKAYAKRTINRYPQARQLSNVRETLVTERSFQTPNGKIVMQLRDKSVVTIEGLPEGEDDHLQNLFEALWKQESLPR